MVSCSSTAKNYELCQYIYKDKVGRPQVSMGLASPWNVIFSLQCFYTVGWVTERTSGL